MSFEVRQKHISQWDFMSLISVFALVIHMTLPVKLAPWQTPFASQDADALCLAVTLVVDSVRS